MSQKTANDVIRVLQQKPHKYTVQIHQPDGSIVEFQHDAPKFQVNYNDSMRQPWLMDMAYPEKAVMEWIPGSVIMVDENPNP